MKTHPLLKAASGLHIACGIASLLTMVYFTVFQVLLAADEDPDVNIAIMACYMLTGIIDSLLEIIAGKDALNQDSLSLCRSLGMSVIPLSIVTVITGIMTGQFWYPYVIAVAITMLYLAGVRKTILS